MDDHDYDLTNKVTHGQYEESRRYIFSAVVAPVRTGDVLAGKYRVDRILGKGGMGVVVAARHLQLDQIVALKFLRPEAVENPAALDRFLREARNAVRLRSEHVARIIDVGTLDSGAPYIVMEYLEGSDLAGVLAQQRTLAVPVAVDFILQACDAIAEAHALGIIHRDLKPENLFVTRRHDNTPLVKVLDFGISKSMAGHDFAATASQTVMGLMARAPPHASTILSVRRLTAPVTFMLPTRTTPPSARSPLPGS